MSIIILSRNTLCKGFKKNVNIIYLQPSDGFLHDLFENAAYPANRAYRSQGVSGKIIQFKYMYKIHLNFCIVACSRGIPEVV